MRIAVNLLIAATFLLAGCPSSGPWRTQSRTVVKVDRQHLGSRVDPRGFAGRVGVRQDGALVFHVTGKCENQVNEVQTVRVREVQGGRRKKNPGRIVSFAFGTLLSVYGLIFSIVGIAVDDGPGPVFRVLGPVFLGVGVPLFTWGVGGLGRSKRRYRTRQEVAPARTRFVYAPCPPGVADNLAPRLIHVRTPWGTVVTGEVNNGVAQVVPDWDRSGISAGSRASHNMLRRPWTVTAPGRSGSMLWRPLPVEQRAMLNAAAAAHRPTSSIVAQPVLSMQCTLPVGVLNYGNRLIAKAGAVLSIRCTLSGKASVAAGARVRARLGNGRWETSAPKDIQPGTSHTFDVSVAVPNGLAPGSRHVLTVWGMGKAFATRVYWTRYIVIGASGPLAPVKTTPPASTPGAPTTAPGQ